MLEIFSQTALLLEMARAPEKGQAVFLSFFETTLPRAGLGRFF